MYSNTFLPKPSASLSIFYITDYPGPFPDFHHREASSSLSAHKPTQLYENSSLPCCQLFFNLPNLMAHMDLRSLPSLCSDVGLNFYIPASMYGISLFKCHPAEPLGSHPSTSSNRLSSSSCISSLCASRPLCSSQFSHTHYSDYTPSFSPCDIPPSSGIWLLRDF